MHKLNEMYFETGFWHFGFYIDKYVDPWTVFHSFGVVCVIITFGTMYYLL